jgi:hypothetical protein
MSYQHHYQTRRPDGFRSGLEARIAKEMKLVGVVGEYEKHRLKFSTKPEARTYTPDFRLPNGIFIETKGRFMASDRKKHLLVRECCPNIEVRFVFQNAKARLSKRSKTTYADWCDKNGFKWAHLSVPREWLFET